jgi:hypothetical protein
LKKEREESPKRNPAGLSRLGLRRNTVGLLHPRVLKDTPRFAAITLVAPGERYRLGMVAGANKELIVVGEVQYPNRNPKNPQGQKYETSDFPGITARRLARPQDHRHGSALLRVVDVDRQEAAFVIMSVE